VFFALNFFLGGKPNAIFAIPFLEQSWKEVLHHPSEKEVFDQFQVSNIDGSFERLWAKLLDDGS
jgi:hypothetical protein